MTTGASGSSLTSVLGVLPPQLRAELLDSFNNIAKNYRERRWEPSELNGGKLSEVAYSIIKGHIDGSYPKRATKPRNMVDACKARRLQRLRRARSASRSHG